MTFTVGGGTKFILVYLNYAIFMVYLMTMPVIQDYTGRVIPINLFFLWRQELIVKAYMRSPTPCYWNSLNRSFVIYLTMLSVAKTT